MKLKKVFRSLLVILTCCLSLSCVLDVLPNDNIGSISFTLPSNVSSRTTDTKVLSNDIPDKYLVQLKHANNSEVGGSVYYNTLKAGETVLIDKLAPGDYVLYVRGESKKYVYEKTDPINVKVGSNPHPVILDVKKTKAQLSFDLSNINFAQDETINIEVKDLNGETIYTANNLKYSKSIITDSQGFLPGNYSVILTTNRSESVRYLVNNGLNIAVPKDYDKKIITVPVTAFPIKTFYVRSSSNGNGTENNPYKSIGSAVDNIIGSINSDYIAKIVLCDDTKENNPIVIKSKYNIGYDISIVGLAKSNTTFPSIDGTILVQNSSLTLKDVILPQSQDKSIVLENSTIVLNGGVTIPNVKFNRSSLIKVNELPLAPINIILDNYSEGEKIIESVKSLDTNLFKLEDPRYSIKADGTLTKARESVIAKLDMLPNNPDTVLTYSEQGSTTKSEYIPFNKKEGVIPNTYFNIGKEYTVDFYVSETIGSEAKYVKKGSGSIVVSDNPDENIVNIHNSNENTYTYYVDSMRGNDYVNEGKTGEDAFETVGKALSTIKSRLTVAGQSQYNIIINGSCTKDKELRIDEIKTLVIEGKEGSNSSIDNPIIVQNTNLTLKNISLTYIETSTSITLDKNPSGSSAPYIQRVKLINDAQINVNCDLGQNKTILELYPEPSLEMVNKQLINYQNSSYQKDNYFSIYSKDSRYLVKPDGKLSFRTPGDPPILGSTQLKFDVPCEEGRYLAKISEPTGSAQNSKEFPINPTSGTEAEIVGVPRSELNDKELIILDKLNYKKEVARKKILTSTTGPISININRDYYVDINGNDSNLGYEVGSPFRNISKAIEVINSKAVNDSEQPYSITVFEPIDDVYKSLGETKVINQPINLTIMGDSYESTALECDLNKSLFEVNHPDATVTIENLNIIDNTIAKDTCDLNNPIIKITSGTLIVGENLNLISRAMVNEDLPKGVRYGFVLGTSAKLKLSNKNQACIGNGVNLIYLNKNATINIVDTYDNNYNPIKLVLSSDFEYTKPVITKDSSTPISKDEISVFFTDDYYFELNSTDPNNITSTGILKRNDGKFTIPVINVPNSETQTADSILASGRYSYKLYDACERVVDEGTLDSHNFTPKVGLNPNGFYTINVTDVCNGLLVSTNSFNFADTTTEDPYTPKPEVCLYAMKLDTIDYNSHSCANIPNSINNYLKNTVSKLSIGANSIPEITAPIDVIILLSVAVDYDPYTYDVKVYPNNEDAFRFGINNINLPNNISIKNIFSEYGATIHINENEKSIITIDNTYVGGQISITGVSFDAKSVTLDPSSKGYITIEKGRLDLLSPTIECKNDKPTIYVGPNGKLGIGGAITIPGTIKLEKATDQYPTITIVEALDSNPITVDVGVSTTPIFLAENSVVLADQITNIKLTDSTLQINSDGTVSKKSVTP